MIKPSLTCSYEDIQDDFSRDICSTIDQILGDDAYESEKSKLMISIQNLFQKQVMEIENAFESNRNDNRNNLPFLNNNFPCINIYYLNNTISSTPSQFFNYNNFPVSLQQQPSNLMYSPNFPQQSFNMMNPHLMSLQNMNPNFVNSQNSNPMFPNFVNFQPNMQSKVAKKKSTKKSNHHHKKSDHRHKKSKEQKKSEDTKNSQIMSFPIKSNFDGIIKYLTVKTGGNIHDNGTIEVTTNSNFSMNSHQPKILLQDGSQYAAKRGDKFAWVCFDFKQMQIEISNYSIKAGTSCSMKNWVLEISDDKSKWDVIDSHNNCMDLKNAAIEKVYNVSQKKFSRFCRIRHTGEFIDYRPNCSMQVSRIEFFGRLKMPS